ncbi:MAG TPA: hypothetical protein DCP92_01690 [Nitrospiraceae bacterium]|nr:hypothetical protein [Nitrospiraceae bacterium]
MRGSVISAMVLLCLLLYGTAFAAGQSKQSDIGTVTGVIHIKGGGLMKGGTVFFFDEKAGPPPSATKYWRVPTYAFEIEDNAHFTVMLPEGDYYMGAIKRQSGQRLGPPHEGDYFFISQDEKGQPKKLRVSKDSKIDLGVLEEAVPFKRETLAQKGITSIQGTIYDENGRPMEGMLVFAFVNPSMFGRPLFVSELSDKLGHYELRLAGEGTFFLLSRTNYGGGPRSTDELLGVYKDSKPVSVKSFTTTTGIDITVKKMGGATSQP